MDKHKDRHIKLHGYLKELLSDFEGHGFTKKMSVEVLLNWSEKQTKKPDEYPVVREFRRIWVSSLAKPNRG